MQIAAEAALDANEALVCIYNEIWKKYVVDFQKWLKTIWRDKKLSKNKINAEGGLPTTFKLNAAYDKINENRNSKKPSVVDKIRNAAFRMPQNGYE